MEEVIGHSYYRKWKYICALSNGDIFNALDEPLNPVFKVTAFLKSNISKTVVALCVVRLRNKIIIEH